MEEVVGAKVYAACFLFVIRIHSVEEIPVHGYLMSDIMGGDDSMAYDNYNEG